MMDGSKPVTLGADDIVQRFMARLDRVEMPEPGAEVRQGEPLVTFRQGKRSLTLVSPLSGTLTEVNAKLSAKPALLRESPYERGWVARIKPSNLQIELHNLLRGALAERWREGVQAQIAAWFSPRLGVVLQDGGQWIDDMGSLVKDDEWDRLAQTLFFVAPMQSNDKS
jgi:glycine cleavage system H lipoate-binding protein